MRGTTNVRQAEIMNESGLFHHVGANVRRERSFDYKTQIKHNGNDSPNKNLR